MARCVTCAAETELYVNGSPRCISCSDKNEAPTRKPLQFSAMGPETNASLNAARDVYKRALRVQAEASNLKHPEGITALYHANRQLELAAAKYEEALREFIARTGMRRRSG
jgi:hypothetical protein